MKIAVLDSDVTTQQLIGTLLRSNNHTTYLFSNSKELQSHLQRDPVDLCILNCRNHPEADEVLRDIKTPLLLPVPVLLIISRAPEEAVIRLLAAGAEDYLVKPIRRHELIMRVNVLLQRFYPDQISPSLQLGKYVFEIQNARVLMAGKPVKLTQKEFELGLFLFQNIEKPLSRAFILETIWKEEPETPSRTLDTHISRVRTKLQLQPKNGFRLVPVYGYGYQLVQIDNNPL